MTQHRQSRRSRTILAQLLGLLSFLVLAAATLRGDPPPEAWFSGFRLGRSAAEAAQTLHTNPALAKARDPLGNTALHHAALFGDASLLKALLAAGCESNATNAIGATPLHYAVDDAEKVKSLLAAGASPNVRTSSGSTPLIVAAKRTASTAVVRALLAAGAQVDARDTEVGATPLVAAAYLGDTETIRLLLEAGADPNARLKPFEIPGLKTPLPTPTNATGLTPLMQAAYAGDTETLRLLLARGVDVNAYSTDVGTALHLTAYLGALEGTRMLLDAGANPNARDEGGRTPLMWAALDETGNPAVVELLLRRGARPNDLAAEDDERPEWIRSALGWARQRGDTPIVRALEKAGATNQATREPRVLKRLPAPAWDAAASQAIARRSLDFLLQADTRFQTVRTCVSCHNQAMPALLLEPARRMGIAYDSAAASRLASRVEAFWSNRIDALLEMNEGLPDTPVGGGYEAWAIDALGRGPNRLTDALTLFLAGVQRPDGRWRASDLRPPQEGSHFASTALSLRVLATFGPPARRAEWSERIARARAWLIRTTPITTEDKTFRLLGLIWSGADASAISAAAAALQLEQRADGGWAQLSSLDSDAYATGQVLWALQAAKLTPADPGIRRGLQYLVETEEDGAWRVRSRVFAFQPSIHGFRYGRDHWISAAATGWAAGALLEAASTSR